MEERLSLSRSSKRILYTAAALLIIIMIFYSLVKAQAFLAPLAIAAILSLVVLPLARKMEHGMSRLLSSLLNALMLFLISLGIIALVVLQFRSLAKDWDKIKDRMKPQIEQAKTYVVEHTPLTEKDLELFEGQGQQDTESASAPTQNKIMSLLGKFLGFIGTYLLVFVYIFFILFYRRRFRVFLLRVFPDEKRQEVQQVISGTTQVAPKYLIGKLILMGIIAVVYAIGLALSGINNFIIVSLIATVLALIPYIGNIIAYFLAMAFGFMTSGDSSVLIGVSLTFGLGQFFQTYFLEPYLLGDKVNVHPFFVILAVIAGNLVWGIVGMVLAIPLLGMLTIVLKHIKELREVGLLLSKEKLEP